MQESFDSHDLCGPRLNGEPIIIHGSFQHPEKGRFVEQSTTTYPTMRSSVSVWEISFPDYRTAFLVFNTFFGLSPEEAANRDARKGVIPNLKICTLSLEELTEELVIEETPETIMISREENPGEEDLADDSCYALA